MLCSLKGGNLAEQRLCVHMCLCMQVRVCVHVLEGIAGEVLCELCTGWANVEPPGPVLLAS